MNRAASNYLDAAAFTRLFRHRRKNHAQICEGIFEICRNLAKRVHFNNASDQDDAIGSATLHALERIDRFKFAQGNNAFAYFTTLLLRQLYRENKASARHKQRERQMGEHWYAERVTNHNQRRGQLHDHRFQRMNHE